MGESFTNISTVKRTQIPQLKSRQNSNQGINRTDIESQIFLLDVKLSEIDRKRRLYEQIWSELLKQVAPTMWSQQKDAISLPHLGPTLSIKNIYSFDSSDQENSNYFNKKRALKQLTLDELFDVKTKLTQYVECQEAILSLNIREIHLLLKKPRSKNVTVMSPSRIGIILVQFMVYLLSFVIDTQLTQRLQMAIYETKPVEQDLQKELIATKGEIIRLRESLLRAIETKNSLEIANKEQILTIEFLHKQIQVLQGIANDALNSLKRIQKSK